MRLELALRHDIPERIQAFREGLRKNPYDGHLFVTWNRFGVNGIRADEVEASGGKVLVVENAHWGNGFLGKQWLSISHRMHNTQQPHGGPERWDSLGVTMEPMRTTGETVILHQRGIGHSSMRCPPMWERKAQAAYGGRIRMHPGKHGGLPLEKDLANCGRVVTWASGAAVKALMMGIPVTSELPGWIAEQDNTEAGRADMFRRLSWSQWTLEEIACGLPFHW